MIKQFYFILISFFILTGLFSQYSNAQTIVKQNINSSQNNEGVLVAYTHNKNMLFIKSKNDSLKIKSIIFYSILGVQTAEFSINANSMEINIDKFRSGKYLMKYTLSDNTQQVIQVIKH